ncbi:hypothetical protein TrLO_g11890 [Triparma laevis f. longispina]|uniref:Uncharacterized protein n=1 Tax=Triparma laevis f. longispina TaxID=1714387 RepID=A0A9W7L1C9_9STRA|nr:hypothetical protein TrLO_g11890 [Triparma laevis f. longispina]
MQIFTTQQLEYSSNPKLETQTLLLLFSLSSLILIVPLHLILEIPQTSSPLNWIIYLFLNLWFFLLAGFNTSTIIPLLIGLLGILTIVFKSYSELSGLISEDPVSQFCLATFFLGGSAIFLVVVAPSLQVKLNRVVERLRGEETADNECSPPNIATTSPIKKSMSI